MMDCQSPFNGSCLFKWPAPATATTMATRATGSAVVERVNNAECNNFNG